MRENGEREGTGLEEKEESLISALRTGWGEHALKVPRAQWGLLTHKTTENRRELGSKAFGEAGIFCAPKLQESLVFLPVFCFSHDSAAYVCPSLLPLPTA